MSSDPGNEELSLAALCNDTIGKPRKGWVPPESY